MVLLGIRSAVEMAFARYWTACPKVNNWREIAEKIIKKHLSDTSDDLVNLTEEVDNRPGKMNKPRGPQLPSKKKIVAEFDEEFYKWVYVSFRSMHKDMIALRGNFAEKQIVNLCGSLSYILTCVHGEVHKGNRRKILDTSISSKEITETLRTEFDFSDEDIDNVLIFLKKKKRLGSVKI